MKVGPPKDGQDAWPALAAALDRVRQAGGGTVQLRKGVYRFPNLLKGAPRHLELTGLHDVLIDGHGATLVFTRNADGVLVSKSQRLKLTDVTIEFDLRTSSVARLVEREGRRLLEVDAAFPVSGADEIHQLVEFDPKTTRWPAGGQRLLFPPGAADAPVFEGDQRYSSAAFAKLDVGKTFSVHHHWYGGAAVKVQDAPGPDEAEDIVIDRVTVRNAPGMAFVGYGIKRGFAVVGSQVLPAPGAQAPLTAEYDAVHIQQVGGDVLIAGNRIAQQGDDGVNVNSVVQPVVSVGADRRELVMGRYSKFISKGDRLAFFDDANTWLGTARVITQPQAVGGLNYRVTIDADIPRLDEKTLARDLDVITNRYVVVDNEIGPCPCNGVLAQAPNGLVAGNTIHDVNHVGIKLLANTGFFQEGSGAFNVVVKNNVLTNTGAGLQDRLGPGDWGAISIYGQGRAGLHRAATNQNIDVVGNQISGATQACIVVTSSRQVRIAGNVCADTNAIRTGPSISLFNVEGATLDGNRRSGTRTGALRMDAATVRAAASQPPY